MKRIIAALACLLVAANALAAGYVGDYAPGDTIDCNFGTVQPSTGASFALAGTPAVAIYKDNGTTESTSGVTLTAGFDSRAGLNHLRITTSSDGSVYSAGSFFSAVLTAGTVDGVSVAGQPVCSFTLSKVAALRPTVPGHTLDVSAGGEAGIDLANVGSPSTTLNLSGTTISNTQQVDVRAISTDTAAADRLEAILDGTCMAFPELGILRGVGCTAQAYTAGTPSLTLDASAPSGNETMRGATLMICGSTQGYCQSAIVDSYDGATKIATLEAALPVTPTGTVTFTAYGTGAPSGVDIKSINGSPVCGSGTDVDPWDGC